MMRRCRILSIWCVVLYLDWPFNSRIYFSVELVRRGFAKNLELAPIWLAYILLHRAGASRFRKKSRACAHLACVCFSSVTWCFEIESEYASSPLDIEAGHMALFEGLNRVNASPPLPLPMRVKVNLLPRSFQLWIDQYQHPSPRQETAMD